MTAIFSWLYTPYYIFEVTMVGETLVTHFSINLHFSSKSVSGSQMDQLARYFCLESLVDNTPHEVEGLKWCRPGGYVRKVVIVAAGLA